MRSQVLRLARPQYRGMCGTLPTHVVCGFEQMKETGENIQLCLPQIEKRKFSLACPQLNSMTDSYMENVLVHTQ